MVVMISTFGTLLVAALVCSTVAAPVQDTRLSPCPNQFKYGSISEGEWSGNLVLNSEDDLHGVWIRVIFDSPLKEVSAEGYEVVHTDDNNKEVLIKSRDFLLKAGSPQHIKITVKYSSDQIPKLLGYRLNAKIVCPIKNSSTVDFFEGDNKVNNFIGTLAKPKPAYKPNFECGLKINDLIPWKASVWLKSDDNSQYICDATLISPSHVILPAHCVTYRKKTEKIHENFLAVTLEGHLEKIGVSKIITHRGYDPDTLAYDVAILKLDGDLKISEKVRPICIDDDPHQNRYPTLTGKPVDSNGIANSSVIEIDRAECEKMKPELSGLLADDTFCVLYTSDSPCVGNSGSSLITSEGEVHRLKGFLKIGPILQNQHHCKTNSTVALAAKVYRYYHWIRNSIS